MVLNEMTKEEAKKMGATHYSYSEWLNEYDYYAKEHDHCWQVYTDEGWDLCMFDVDESLLKPL